MESAPPKRLVLSSASESLPQFAPYELLLSELSPNADAGLAVVVGLHLVPDTKGSRRAFIGDAQWLASKLLLMLATLCPLS